MLCPPCCATARLLRAEAFKYLDIIVLLQFTIGFLIAHRPGCKQRAEDVGNNTERYIRIGFITVSDEIRPTQEVDQQISQGNAAQLFLKRLILERRHKGQLAAHHRAGVFAIPAHGEGVKGLDAPLYWLSR